MFPEVMTKLHIWDRDFKKNLPVEYLITQAESYKINFNADVRYYMKIAKCKEFKLCLKSNYSFVQEVFFFFGYYLVLEWEYCREGRNAAKLFYHYNGTNINTSVRFFSIVANT